MKLLNNLILSASLATGIFAADTNVAWNKTPNKADVTLTSGDPTASTVTLALFASSVIVNGELPSYMRPIRTIQYKRAANEVVMVRSLKLAQLSETRSGKYVVAVKAANAYGIETEWTWKALEIVGPPNKVDLKITFETNTEGIKITNVLQKTDQEVSRFPAPVE